MEKLKYLTVRDIASRFRVRPKTVQSWCRKGLIKGFKENRHSNFTQWFIPETELAKISKIMVKSNKSERGKKQPTEYKPKIPPCKPQRVEQNLYFCPRIQGKLRGGAGLCFFCDWKRFRVKVHEKTG